MTKKDDFDLQDFLPYLLNQAAEASGLGFQRVYKGRYGMLRTEWRVLFHLGMYGRLTAKEIGDRSKTHKTKISRAVAALERRRFLAREKSDRDRRHEFLTLTAQGQAAYDDLRNVARGYDRKLVDGLPTDDVARLRDMLRQLAEMRT